MIKYRLCTTHTFECVHFKWKSNLLWCTAEMKDIPQFVIHSLFHHAALVPVDPIDLISSRSTRSDARLSVEPGGPPRLGGSDEWIKRRSDPVKPLQEKVQSYKKNKRTHTRERSKCVFRDWFWLTARGTNRAAVRDGGSGKKKKLLVFPPVGQKIWKNDGLSGEKFVFPALIRRTVSLYRLRVLPPRAENQRRWVPCAEPSANQSRGNAAVQFGGRAQSAEQTRG